uniref:DNA topoisomerase 2 n=1 Tax=Ditylenchus dipsaci TaxID=166011 RepID=A0A915EL59_9BILA
MVKEEFHVILALSITKWIHLNWGDDGLRRFFKRAFLHLCHGGRLILEPQEFSSYSKKSKMAADMQKNYKDISFKPEQFTEYLLSEEVEELGVPEACSKGFERPILVFVKSAAQKHNYFNKFFRKISAPLSYNIAAIRGLISPSFSVTSKRAFQIAKMTDIEKTYQKKTQLEHILLRPDTYIGSVEFCTKTLMEKNEISIYNNGKGIPVAMHNVEKMYVPEMIFGTLLTSSNYNDDERKVTGGRNGYGAKLCNIFSTKFVLETSSKEYGKKFKQTWVNSMTKQGEATIEKCTEADFTKITFQPDLKRFGMKELDDDIISLMCRRAFDVAGTSRGVKVFLNNTIIPCLGFKQYVDRYIKDRSDDAGEPMKVAFEHVNDRWRSDIATSKGGRHVDYVADQVVSKLIETVKKKIGKNSIAIKPFQIKNHMWIFVNSLIENPHLTHKPKRP